MNKFLLLLFAVAGFSCSLEVCPDSHINAYHFDAPAQMWEETFPLGNGRIGIMPDGGVDTENFVLNEISMWSGSRQNSDNPEALKALPRIRELLFAGRNAEAQELMYKSFTCGGAGTGGAPYGSYQLLGNLKINYHYDNQEDTSLYRRELVIDQARVSESFSRGKTYYQRNIFTSFSDDVAVIHLFTDTKSHNALNFTVSMNRPERAKITLEGADVKMSGQLNDGYNGDKGVKYGAQVRILLPKGGELVSSGDTAMSVKGATEAVLLVAMATDYFGKDVDNQLNTVLTKASAKSANKLRHDHITTYYKLFSRVKVDFGHNPEREKLPINDRLNAFNKNKNDPSLADLYYQFGRYLLISSTRTGSLPPNLQGLWANTIRTPWNGDYHTNINVQMNHWLAEPGNLSELHLPLIEWIAQQVKSGQHTAQVFYGARGWVMHTPGNVWEFTAPGEHPSWGASNTSAAWLCEHLYTHYLYTLDEQYLADVYNVMREAALFYVDMLVEDPRSHYLVTAPTNSPENGYRLPDGKSASVCAGSTMDNQIVRELFTNTIAAAKTLGIDSEFCDTLAEKRARLMPTTIGPDGRIMEWLENYEETEIHHRHVSHLYGLHPANEISVELTPELAAAARKTLEVRGDESTGWSMAWKMLFWARLHDGEHAFKLLTDLLRPCVEKGFNYAKGGGTYPNLFDGHPPFQIDGNFGGAAGIGEMLLQSQNGYIELLPALPKEWNTGSFEGLRVHGGGEISASWSNGKLTAISLKALNTGCFKIKISDNMTINNPTINRKPVKPTIKNGLLEVNLQTGDVFFCN
ncbi:MAG: glycoside hydrolase family 95 protein [Tannerella sp.]|nr:glycoside hydrolase family 95 protein [Tannerella sp.]